jgi:hypothetical protein
MHRRRLLALAPALLSGCAREFKPLQFAAPVPLQDPLPGSAIVYFMRVPHDPVTLAVLLNKTRIAVLTPETYTVVSLQPGSYGLFALSPTANLPQGDDYQPTGLTVAAGERRLIYTSQPTRSSESLGLLPFKAGVVPLLLPIRTAAGARNWRECSEPDAQGLLSISRYARPERDAL